LKIQVQPASNVGSPVFRFSSPIVKSTEAEVLPPLSVSKISKAQPFLKALVEYCKMIK